MNPTARSAPGSAGATTKQDPKGLSISSRNIACDHGVREEALSMVTTLSRSWLSIFRMMNGSVEAEAWDSMVNGSPLDN